AYTRLRKGEIEFVARARDSDIKQPPLFFERIARVERATAWKHSVRQPDHEHSVKLKPFGLMHRGKVYRLLIARLVWRGFCIDIADERQLRKKFVHVLKLPGKHRELIQVFASQFVIREIHLRVVVVDCFDHGSDHFRWRVWLPAWRDLIERMRDLFPSFS